MTSITDENQLQIMLSKTGWIYDYNPAYFIFHIEDNTYLNLKKPESVFELLEFCARDFKPVVFLKDKHAAQYEPLLLAKGFQLQQQYQQLECTYSPDLKQSWDELKERFSQNFVAEVRGVFQSPAENADIALLQDQYLNQCEDMLFLAPECSVDMGKKARYLIAYDYNGLPRGMLKLVITDTSIDVEILYCNARSQENIQIILAFLNLFARDYANRHLYMLVPANNVIRILTKLGLMPTHRFSVYRKSRRI